MRACVDGGNTLEDCWGMHYSGKVAGSPQYVQEVKAQIGAAEKLLNKKATGTTPS
jgi:hypothetical protein